MKNHLEDLNLFKIISQLAECQPSNQQLSMMHNRKEKENNAYKWKVIGTCDEENLPYCWTTIRLPRFLFSSP